MTGTTGKGTVGPAIGATLRELREGRAMSARQLATRAELSAAMISRIESGSVSPSIATLEAIAGALDVPLVSLFRDTTTGHANFTHVKAGQGLPSTRISEDHVHEYLDLATRMRRDIRFQASLITLHRQDAKPPIYVGHGVIFIHVMRGEAVYLYGPREITLGPGDSLSVDAELRHGFARLITDEFVFLNVQAEKG